MFSNFLNDLKARGNQARQGLVTEISKYKNRDYMQSVVAGCAYMAFADKNVSAEEKQKMYGFMQNSDELKVFDTKEVIEFFNQIVGKFEFDFDIGAAEALKIIGKQRGKEGARTLVRVTIAVANSDNNFDQAEKAVGVIICRELGLDPAEFGLS